MMVLRRTKTAAYFEGYQAVSLRQQCQYTDKPNRDDWARGFKAGLVALKGSTVWWKSRTILVGVVLLILGLGIAVYGLVVSENAYTGFGGGISSVSLIMAAMRLITGTSVSLTAGLQQYNVPPFISG